MEKNKDQKIFEYFLQEHNLTLLQSDIDAIVKLVNKELDKELCETYMKLNATNAANAGYQELNKKLEEEIKQIGTNFIKKGDYARELEELLKKKEGEILNLHSAMDAMDETINCAEAGLVDMGKKIDKANEQVNYLKEITKDIDGFRVENCRLKQKIKSLLKENQDLKESLAPFEDEYFKDLTNGTVAGLAKKSIRITAENSKLINTLEEIKIIANNAFRICDDDCGNASSFAIIANKIKEVLE